METGECLGEGMALWDAGCRMTPEVPGTGGLIKRCPADFQVEEIPAYRPLGHGEHLFLWIEKVGLAAHQLPRILGDLLNIKSSDIGMAGQKDKHARTRQFISVPWRSLAALGGGGLDPRRLRDALAASPWGWEADVGGETAGSVGHGEQSAGGVRLLRWARHPHKLRTGHLRGNRFVVTVRSCASADAYGLALATVHRLRERGMPNYFGRQRFGRQGDTLRQGLALLGESAAGAEPGRGDGRGSRRGRLDGRRRRLLLSCVQSAVFNRCLAARMRAETVHQAQLGDVAMVRRSGGPFVVADVERERKRVQAGGVVLAGPMPGLKMLAAEAEVARDEAEVCQALGLTKTVLAGQRRLLSGTRRPYVVWPSELVVKPLVEPGQAQHEHGLVVSFGLPAGSYATVLLAEIMGDAVFAKSE